MQLNNDMKKFTFGVITGIAIVLVLELAMFGVMLWHIKETEACSRWKVNSLAIIDEIKEKQREYSWTDEEAYTYGEKLKDSLNITYPRPCPYCIVKSLFYR